MEQRAEHPNSAHISLVFEDVSPLVGKEITEFVDKLRLGLPLKSTQNQDGNNLTISGTGEQIGVFGQVLQTRQALEASGVTGEALVKHMGCLFAALEISFRVNPL